MKYVVTAIKLVLVFFTWLSFSCYAFINAEQINTPINDSDSKATSENLRVVILGTGTPNADPERSGPSVAVISQGHSYLVDAGPGVVRRAAAAALNNEPSLKANHLTVTFLSHLHSDHTLGLADLIFTPWVLERETPLKLYGPQGTKNMAHHISAAYQQDVDLRLNGLEPANEEGYKVSVTEISQAGEVYKDNNIRVEAVPVLHGSWESAFGYKFTHNNQSVLISGDARVSPALIEAAKGVDILVHEVYSVEGFKTRPPVWQKYHASFHTSTKELADIANQVKPKLLVLYHQLYWGVSDQDLINEIRQAGYQGKVISAADLDVYTVE